MEISAIDAIGASPFFDPVFTAASTGPSTVDVYVAPAPDSVPSQLLAEATESGRVASASFHRAAEHIEQSLKDLDFTDPLAAMQALLDLQMRIGAAQLKVEFATSLAKSANHGFSTLFQMQS